MTIIERLDTIDFGIDAESLAIYEGESKALKKLIERINKASGYYQASELKNGLELWISRSNYSVNKNDEIVRKLANLGIIMPKNAKTPNIGTRTTLGEAMLSLYDKGQELNWNCADNQLSVDNLGQSLVFDDDGDCPRTVAASFFEELKRDFDVIFIMSLIKTSKEKEVENPSPPMRKKMGIE